MERKVIKNLLCIIDRRASTKTTTVKKWQCKVCFSKFGKKSPLTRHIFSPGIKDYISVRVCQCSIISKKKYHVRVCSCSIFSKGKNHVRVRSCSIFSRIRYFIPNTVSIWIDGNPVLERFRTWMLQNTCWHTLSQKIKLNRILRMKNISVR